MRENLQQRLEETIQPELNVAETYTGFHKKIHEDAGSWREISVAPPRLLRILASLPALEIEVNFNKPLTLVSSSCEQMES